MTNTKLTVEEAVKMVEEARKVLLIPNWYDRDTLCSMTGRDIHDEEYQAIVDAYNSGQFDASDIIDIIGIELFVEDVLGERRY
jgi:hypothetical protein